MGKMYLNGVLYGEFSHHYSTSEKVIGKWVNNKPLYEKTKILEFSDLTQIGIQYYASISDSADEVVRGVTGYAKSGSYGICCLGCRNYETTSSANDYYWEFAQYGDNISLIFVGYNASDIDINEVVITYQYTKTTD